MPVFLGLPPIDMLLLLYCVDKQNNTQTPTLPLILATLHSLSSSVIARAILNDDNQIVLLIILMDHAEDTTLQSTSILLVMIPEYYIIPQQVLKRGKGTKNNIDVNKKRRR
jgi:hypothetical protein